MDSLITAAARSLAAGDAIGALNYVALREDPAALALRAIAMAQLGEFVRARALLRRAAREFGPREAVARARCIVAEAEIALVSRDLVWPAEPLASAAIALERRGDRGNAAHARYLTIRRLLLIGRLDEAERLTAAFDVAALPMASRAAYELVLAGISIRRLRATAARAALKRATNAAGQVKIPSLVAEVDGAARILDAPAARLITRGAERILRLDDIEALLATKTLVVDACRHIICHSGDVISLEARPVLFALAQALAEAWPVDQPRATLLARAFRAKHADESHRARLRVEIGRLRKALSGVAEIRATKSGFVLSPLRAREVAVLAPPADVQHAPVLALLSDGEAWSSSALALALGASQRTVQRALDDLAAGGQARGFGRGRARRWMSPPMPDFPTALLLPATLPGV